MPALVRPIGDERDGSLAYLDQQRHVLRVAAFGLTDEQARATPTTSSLCIGGLIKHAAATERRWIATIQRRVEGPYLDYAANFRFGADDTLSDVLASYADAARETEEVLAGIADLGQPVPVPRGSPWFPDDVEAWSVRWVLLHLIEETARHAGHADIIREAIDGATAFPLMARVEGWPASPLIRPWEPGGSGRVEVEPDQGPSADEAMAGQKRTAIDLVDHWTAIALRTVIDVGVIEAFAGGPRSSREVADEVGVDAPTLDRTLRLLAGRGVFVEDGEGRFHLSEVGELFLLDHVDSLVGLATWKDWEVHAWAEFEHTLRTGESGFVRHFGTTYWDWLAAHPEASGRFDRSMERRTGSLLRFARSFLRRLPDEGRIVDVGGGNGALIAMMLGAVPGLTGVLFDRPQVVSSAGAVLRRAGVEGRVEVVGGDFLESVPAGGDVYVLASVLHDWDDPDATRILRNVREAMGPGATLVVLDAIVRGPNEWDTFKGVDLHMLVLFGARERDEAQWRELFEGGGFEMTEAFRSPGLAWIEAVPVGG